MKIAVLVGDGMGDYPLAELQDRTPLQVAQMPHIRQIAAAGTVHLIRTVPHGLAPGSDVGNLSLLGFDPREYRAGRAALEAAGAGIGLHPDDVAFRCNLVTVADSLMKDYSAGHITSEEARGLIAALNGALGGDGRCFYPRVSYRHLLVWRDGPGQIVTVPPHDITGQPIEAHLPSGPKSEMVTELMNRSCKLFHEHPVNAARVAAGKNPATQIWLWGQGCTLELPRYPKVYGLTGSVISAVDLVRGLGKLAGLEPVLVPGATGFIDTNYDGKVQAALDALSHGDYAFVHVEAPDETGHLGDIQLKLKAIELFDEQIVGPVWAALEASAEPYRLVVCTDHRTPIAARTHTDEPVPVAILDGPVGPVREQAAFDEFVGEPDDCPLAFELVRDRVLPEPEGDKP